MMKKTVLALSLSVLSVLGFSAMAQNQKSNNNGCVNKEVCKKDSKKDKDCKDCKKFEKKQFNPFEGLNLTQAQEQKLAALKPQKPEGKPEGQRPEGKQQMTPEQRQAKMQERDQKSREYLANVKAILTPEQYVSFLENVAIHKDGKRHDGKMMGRKGDNRDNRGMKGQRGGNGQRPNQPAQK